MRYETLKVRHEDSVCFVQIDRPAAGNTIDGTLVLECADVLSRCESGATIVVLSGTPEVFCLGADFSAVAAGPASARHTHDGPAAIYDLWMRFATGPYITISLVRGRANAGGIGFIGASDIVLAEDSAQFSLSELLFGVFPACVMPFLVRRIGFQRANYLALMTQPFSAAQACEWGLADARDASGESLLRRHLPRLRKVSKAAIARYKQYMSTLHPLADRKQMAVAANLELFSDPVNIEAIRRYVEHGVFPWEQR